MRGNKTVILLPLAVMLGLFAFGYFSLNQTGGFSNTDLEENMEILYEYNETHLINWQWGSFPEDGVVGDDYLEVVMDTPQADSAVLRLVMAGETLYETSEWITTQDGIAVSFPTYADGEQIVGAIGHWEIETQENITSIRYFHTWSGADVELSEQDDLSAELQDTLGEEFWMTEQETE